MILLLEREGQMCNQLMSLASVYSLSIEYHEKLICPVIDNELKRYFKFKDNSPENVKMYYSKYWYCVALFLKVIKNGFHIKGMQVYKKGRRFHLFYTWGSHTDNQIFVKHVKNIRNYFSLNDDIDYRCKKIIKELKGNNKIIVGVHLRRGDYREFENGKYYYDDDRVIGWLLQLVKKSAFDIHFLLCSNEKVDCEKYKIAGLSVSQPGKSSIEDLCLLSKADYVMGPPSTYSFWAAMYGNKKRCILSDSNMSISWNDFRYFEDRLREGDYIR